MVTVLTVAPLGGTDMRKWCGGWAQRQGAVVEVPTAANLSVRAIPDAARALDTVIRDTPGKLIVFAHSQGAQVVSEWLREYASADPDRLEFVLTGNLERKHYGYAARKPKWVWGGNIRGLTPDDTGYKVLDIGRKGDLWANYPGGVLAMLGLALCWPHLNYSKVNPDAIDPRHVVKIVGGTTYVVCP
ncbi:MAG: PE-PPE domain-containing protein [Actinomycetia bacterium]|nr:PE-PPE domain-containing protein [Actinomycetes bacterium]